MMNNRPYKDPYPEDQALEIIDDRAGTQFDPDVHAAFRDTLPEVQSIRERFADRARCLPEQEEHADEANLVC